MSWSTPWFDSRYYELLYGHRDERDAALWVEAILGRWRLPAGSRVLDMACGRGRHARCLVSAGMRVTGIDLSPASIAAARERVPEAEFHVHDMREPIPGAEFDAAICLFTSIGYTSAPEDDLRVLRSAHTMLARDGHFVLDFMNTPKVLGNAMPGEDRLIAGVRFHTERRQEQGTLVKSITVDDDGRMHRFEERVRLLLPSQLERLAEEAGLVVVDRTDGPRLDPFDPIHSDRFVLWTTKRTA